MTEKDDVFLDDEAGRDPDAETLARSIAMPSHEELVKNVADLETKLQDQLDKMLRVQAEMENTRRRAKQDVLDAHQFGLKKFITELLPVIDTLERSLEVEVGDHPLASSMRQGMEMTLNLFLTTLQKFNVEAHRPLGEMFNSEYHTAIQTVEDAEEASGTIINVLQKGYTLNGRLLRPAMVIIVK